MKNYEFTVRLAACGETPEEAWQYAIEAFTQDPGSSPDGADLKVLEEEEPERETS